MKESKTEEDRKRGERKGCDKRRHCGRRRRRHSYTPGGAWDFCWHCRAYRVVRHFALSACCTLPRFLGSSVRFFGVNEQMLKPLQIYPNVKRNRRLSNTKHLYRYRKRNWLKTIGYCARWVILNWALTVIRNSILFEIQEKIFILQIPESALL